jgi:hypothetical protein
MMKSLDAKLARIHADPHGCKDFILADAKDADMAFGLGAPGQSPESHAGEVRYKSLEEYRDQIRAITRQGLVDIMLMSVSNNFKLTIEERLFEHSAVTPAIRANDTTDVHIARGSAYATAPSRPFRTASIDHAQCGHLDCQSHERSVGANLGLYSVTFNNDPARDLETLEQFHIFRQESERKGFRYFLEVFDPNVPGAIDPATMPSYVNDMITRMLAGVAPAGRPQFLKIVYHGPRALEELVEFDPHLVVGILGGSAGTTRDAFQLIADAKRYGGRVALFGRKINNAENQLAFVQFLRLIADDALDPVEAVKAYHAVLRVLGIPATRPLESDLQLTTGSTNYGGTTRATTVVPGQRHEAQNPFQRSSSALRKARVQGGTTSLCACEHDSRSDARTVVPGHCGCGDRGKYGWLPKSEAGTQRRVTESSARVPVGSAPHGTKTTSIEKSESRPDFAVMDAAARLAYHRKRLGLGN